MSLVAVVEARVEVPDAVRVVTVVVAKVADVVAVSVPVTSLEVVALVAVRLVKNPVTAVKRLAKKLVLVALVVLRLVIVPVDAVSDEMVVVARVEVPRTARVPLARTLPEASTAKLRFSVQLEPFQ